MTTAAFVALRPKIQAALVHVKKTYCAPPAFKPAADVAETMPCPRCGSNLAYTVAASTGLSEGRCTAACGVKWSDQ